MTGAALATPANMNRTLLKKGSLRFIDEPLCREEFIAFRGSTQVPNPLLWVSHPLVLYSSSIESNMLPCEVKGQMISRLVSRRRAGFSLLEALIVVAITAILSAMALPRFLSLLNSYRINDSARRVQSVATLAHVKA